MLPKKIKRMFKNIDDYQAYLAIIDFCIIEATGMTKEDILNNMEEVYKKIIYKRGRSKK